MPTRNKGSPGGSDASPNQQTFDLASLSDDDLVKAAKKCGCPWGKNDRRPDVIKSLRAGGYDQYWPASTSSSDAVDSATSTELADLRRVVTSLSEEVCKIADKLASFSSPPLLEAVHSIQAGVQRLQEQDATVSSPNHEGTMLDAGSMNCMNSDTAGDAGAGVSRSPSSHHQWSTVARKPPKAGVPPVNSDPYKYNLLGNDKETHAPVTELQSSERITRAVFNLSRIKPGTTANTIVQYCASRSVKVTNCTIYQSPRRFGTVDARLTIVATATEKVLAKDFWPPGVGIRKWSFDICVTVDNLSESMDADAVKDQCAGHGFTPSTCKFVNGPTGRRVLLWVKKDDVNTALSPEAWPTGVTISRQTKPTPAVAAGRPSDNSRNE